MPHLATFISFIIEYVIASIAYIYPAYSGIWAHDLLVVSLLPQPLDQASRLQLLNFSCLTFESLHLPLA